MFKNCFLITHLLVCCIAVATDKQILEVEISDKESKFYCLLDEKLVECKCLKTIINFNGDHYPFSGESLDLEIYDPVTQTPLALRKYDGDIDKISLIISYNGEKIDFPIAKCEVLKNILFSGVRKSDLESFGNNFTCHQLVKLLSDNEGFFQVSITQEELKYLKAGDIICMIKRGQDEETHSAVFIGENTFLSKIGESQMIVSTLEQLYSIYSRVVEDVELSKRCYFNLDCSPTIMSSQLTKKTDSKMIISIGSEEHSAKFFLSKTFVKYRNAYVHFRGTKEKLTNIELIINNSSRPLYMKIENESKELTIMYEGKDISLSHSKMEILRQYLIYGFPDKSLDAISKLCPNNELLSRESVEDKDSVEKSLEVGDYIVLEPCIYAVLLTKVPKNLYFSQLIGGIIAIVTLDDLLFTYEKITQIEVYRGSI